MRSKALGAVLAVPVLAALAVVRADAPAPSSSSRRVLEVGDAYLKLVLDESPLLRLKHGLPIERLPDVSLAQEERDAAAAASLLARLDAIRASDLDHEEVLSLDVLRRQLRAALEAPKHHWLRFPVTPYASPIGGVNQVFAALPLADKAGADRYLVLLRQYPGLVRGLRETLEGQASRGITIPREELELVAPFLRSLIGSAESGPFAVKPERLASLPTEEAGAFRAELARVLEKEVNPALEDLVAYVSGKYRQRAPKAVGLGQYPGGREHYAYLVRYHTTLDVTAEEVHRIGLAEVARVEAEMQLVRERVGFQGTRDDFMRFLRMDPRFLAKTPDEVGERLLGHLRRIEPKVDAFFLRKPQAPYGVKRLEPQLEAGQTFGYYQIPSASDPAGYYRFNGSQLSERSLVTAAALISHELVPGHHFQINLAFENQGIPAFRRDTFDTAYTEGWGEYASDLAGEMGMYANPYDRYGRLAMEMFVTVRLVVDTGMNALGWSRAKAMEYMRDHLLESDTQIATESLRYSCDIPGQALAYKIGARKIRELRQEAEQALGSRFDVRRFHDAMLGSGSLPLPTLERHIDWFIEQERKR